MERLSQDIRDDQADVWVQTNTFLRQVRFSPRGGISGKLEQDRARHQAKCGLDLNSRPRI